MTFLALDRKDWTKWALTLAAAAVIAMGAWFLFVRDTLRAAPSRAEVRRVIEVHSEIPHPVSAPLETAVENRRRIQAIETEQKVQTERFNHIKEGLGEIKVELKRRRNRRR